MLRTYAEVERAQKVASHGTWESLCFIKIWNWFSQYESASYIFPFFAGLYCRHYKSIL